MKFQYPLSEGFLMALDGYRFTYHDEDLKAASTNGMLDEFLPQWRQKQWKWSLYRLVLNRKTTHKMEKNDWKILL